MEVTATAELTSWEGFTVQNQEVTGHAEGIMAIYLMGECKGKERGKLSCSLFLGGNARVAGTGEGSTESTEGQPQEEGM